jgi:amino acid transporter
MILVGALCSAFGYLSGDMLSTPRSLFGFARSGFLPPAFGRLHSEYRTPYVAIWTHAAIVLVVASSSTFQRLAIITNVAVLSLYLLASASALELVRRDVRAGGIPFSIPGRRLIPIASMAAIVWILASASLQEVAVTGATLVVATIAYRLRRRSPMPSEPAPAEI